MTEMAKLWKASRPKGYGKVPWLTHFRCIPEVLVSKYSEEGSLGRKGQLLISYINARLMECAWECWVEAVQSTRDWLQDSTTCGAMQRHLELRAIMCRIQRVTRHLQHGWRKRTLRGDMVRLSRDKHMNLHRALSNAKASMGQYGHNMEDDRRRFKDELRVIEKMPKYGSTLNALVLIRWFQYEWQMKVTDIEPVGERQDATGPWMAVPNSERASSQERSGYGWSAPTSRTLPRGQNPDMMQEMATEMSGRELVARCGGYYPYFEREAGLRLDEIQRQDPALYRHEKKHDELRQIFVDEHVSGRIYWPGLPAWEARGQWMHVYRVCEKLPESLLWEPWDMKPKLHEMTVALLAMFLPACREARRQEVGLRVLDIVKAIVPDEVFLRE